jgi:hypothetical protein
MKTRNHSLAAGIALTAIVIGLFLVLSGAGPALSSATLAAFAAQASTPTPLPDDVIPLKSISELSSLNATVTIDVNGLIDGQRAQGDLTALLATNDQGKSKVTVSGGLLGDIAAQVGGSVVGLFTPSKVDLYKVPQGAYVVVNGLFPLCVKPDAANATEALDKMSPSGLLDMLTNSDVARGELVGEETLNGSRQALCRRRRRLPRGRAEQRRSAVAILWRGVVVGRGHPPVRGRSRRLSGGPARQLQRRLRTSQVRGRLRRGDRIDRRQR